MVRADKLTEDWLCRLALDRPEETPSTHQGLVRWLLGCSPERFDHLTPEQFDIASQSIEYRYRLFQTGYRNLSPERGYQHLVKRLSRLFLLRHKISTWVTLSRDRQRTVVDVIQEVIQEMMRSDRHLGEELQWIATCTPQARLRNLLMLASIEEYCLRPIRNQPLILYRFVNYLHSSQRSGMTHVPSGELIQVISDELALGQADESISRLDVEAWNRYQAEQNSLDQQLQRTQVKNALITYLDRQIGPDAVTWLKLHLQGLTPEQIAPHLQWPVKKVYRLREQVTYHALKGFALKEQPAMVLDWLKTSLIDHRFGLTPTQWTGFWQNLSPEEQAILESLQGGQSLEIIAQNLAIKPKQVKKHWVNLYLRAQALRN
ncbi:MAG: HetZ-related protein 2 [Nodosilinea sp.]